MNNINYRQDQIQIMEYKGGTMAVPAVPGAGKTFIVTNLVAKLLRDGKHEKSKILILTYMNSAVNNFKGRIKKILIENEIKEENSYEVMTIHSLAVKIIKEKPEVVMLDEEFSIADDYQKNIILNECIQNYRRNGGEKIFQWFLKEQKDTKWREKMLDAWENGFYDLVGNSISELKYKEISPKNLEEKIDSSYKGILRIILQIYIEYEKKLKYHGLLDYDDILILAYKALILDDDLRSKFQKRYKFIFEDECQDSNEIQGKIIKLICGENNNLVRVGDINQSITGTFSSSDPKYFKDFIKDADNCYRMDMSNRSSKDILELTNKFVKYITNELNQKECRDALENMEIKTVPCGMGYKENPKPDIYSINTKRYKTWNEEIEKTVAYAKAIKNKYPNKSIGILVPLNTQITEVSKELIEQNLEFEELGPNSLNKRKILNNIAYIIDFILNCDDIEKLIITLDNVFIKYDNETKKIDLMNLLKKYNTEDILYNFDNIEDFKLNDDSKLYSSFSYGIKSLREILEYPLSRLDLLILFIGERLNLEIADKALVEYIAFYTKYICLENININLRDIYEILTNIKNKVFNHIIEVVYEMNGYEPKPGSITICNYHKSKGMEWDCVFLLGLVEYNFPDNINQKFQCDKWYLKDKYKNPVAVVKSEIDKILGNELETDYFNNTKLELINEKIRLLYVGITRAKEMLILSCSIYKDENDIGKRNKEQKSCLYINELERYINYKRSNMNNI